MYSKDLIILIYFCCENNEILSVFKKKFFYTYSRDKVKSKIFLKLQCSATLDGYYLLKGSVLVVPFEGNGKIHVDLSKLICTKENFHLPTRCVGV